MSTTLRISIDEYHAMISRGAFNDLRGRHIELIHGELRAMSPQGPWHSKALRRLIKWSRSLPLDAMELSVQSPITIESLDSEPEPDIVWLKAQAYDNRHPGPEDVLLLIEVAYSTLREDLGENAELYAQAGISDYWVVDLANRVVHIFRQPKAVGYAVHEQFTAGEMSPLAFPHLKLAWAELFE